MNGIWSKQTASRAKPQLTKLEILLNLDQPLDSNKNNAM